MSFWYNKKDGEKIATLNASNWLEVNSKIEFTEFGFTSDDTFYMIVGQASKFTGINKMGEKDFKLADELVQFKIAKKNYVKKDWKTKADVSIEQTRLEKWICLTLDNLNSELRYSGKIELSDANILDMIIKKQDATGRDIPDATIEMLQSGILDIEVIEENLITSDMLNIPTYKSSSFSKGQTEGEKIKDRLAFVETQVKELWDVNDDKSVIDFLVSSLGQGDEKVVYFLQVIDKLIA